MEPQVPLETATYISDLVPSNPASSDPLSGADDHLRLIKGALRATLAHTGQLTNTDNQLVPAGGNGAKPAYAFATEPSLGFFRFNTGVIGYAGTLLGAAPIGSLIDHCGPTAPTGYAACDGTAVSRTTYAALFAVIGTTWGAGDGSTTFNLPDLRDRFRRHKGTAAGVVGATQADQNKSHTHTVSGTTGVNNADHTHTFSGNTGAMSANATHSHTYSGPALGQGTGTSPNYFFSSTGTGTTSTVNTDHTHPFSGTTAGASATHAHAFSGTTSTGSADGAEARPLSATVLVCIRVL